MEMNEKTITEINKFLTKNTSLEDLNLSNCHISNPLFKELKYCLTLNTTLKVTK